MTAEKRLKEYIRVGEVNKKRFSKAYLSSTIKAISKSLKLEVGRLTIRSSISSNPSKKWTRAKAVPVGGRGEKRMRNVKMSEAARLG